MRVLALFSFSFAVSIVLANELLPGICLLPVGAVFFLTAGPLFVLSRKDARERRKRAGICCLGLGFGLIWFFLWTSLSFVPLDALDGRTVRITATVVEWPNETQYGYAVVADIDLEEGGRARTLLYLDEQGEPLRPGDRIETVAYLVTADRTFSGEEITFYTAKGILLQGKGYGLLTVDRPDSTPLSALPALLANHLKACISSAFPEDAAALVIAVVTGSREGLSDQFTSSLQRTGLSHTVAVSGMHLTYLSGFIGQLLGRHRRRTALTVIPLTLFFMLVAGCTPSIVRATVMVVLLNLAALADREQDSLTALGVAIFVLLLQNPMSASHVGLQLSFASVAGMLLFSDRVEAWLSGIFSTVGWMKKLPARCVRVLRIPITVFAATAGAMAFTTPLGAVYFGQVSLIAPLANLMTLWAISFVFCGGLTVGLLAMVLPSAAQMLAFPLAVLVRYLEWMTNTLARLRFAAIPMDSFYYQILLGFFYLLLLCAVFRRQKENLRGAVLVCCVALVGAVCFHLGSYHLASLTVSVLDVGQGQSVLLHAGGRYVLVDCGGDSGDDAGDVAANMLQGLGENKLDLLVLTHFHADHANGVLQLLKRIEVCAILMPEPEGDSVLEEAIVSLAREQGIELVTVTGDTTVELGGEATLTVYPPLGSRDINERGLSLLCTDGTFDVLITGDMGQEVERLLMEHARFPKVEILVAGHHGSKTSTSRELLEQIRPDTVVISAGSNNLFGHPHQEMLRKLFEQSIDIYRTDWMGTVTIQVKT